MDLLREIARCPNVKKCLPTTDGSHPCSEIVGIQKKPLEEHQVPEPWSGHLDRAPLLFLSSNPSLSWCDAYPRWKWTDDEVAGFFTHRFGGGSKLWIKDGRYVLRQDGEHDRKPVSFWANVRSRAAELLGNGTVSPGIDYVLSEIVHCKSTSEQGVRHAANECADLYLDKIASQAKAHVIICLGKVAEDAARRIWQIGGDHAMNGPIPIGQRERYVVFLPHPNAFQPKTFAKSLSSAELERLRDFLHAR